MRIEIEHLSFIYSPGLPYETKALDDIDLVLEPGQFTALIGHTGCGKSTLTQQICGLLQPTSGRLLADGVDINSKTPEARAAKRKIGLVFQYPEYQLFEETVLKDVCFGPKNQGFTEEECLAKAKRALQLVGIDPEEKGEESPFALSGGQKRRVAIAGVLAMEPELLILDEPTAGLDPKGHSELLEMIDRLQEQTSMSIVLVSHNMEDVARLADRVLVMSSGRLVLDGTPRQVYSDSRRLAEYGLMLPQPAEFMELLAERLGTDAPDTNVLTTEEAAARIIGYFEERRQSLQK